MLTQEGLCSRLRGAGKLSSWLCASCCSSQTERGGWGLTCGAGGMHLLRLVVELICIPVQDTGNEGKGLLLLCFMASCASWLTIKCCPTGIT